jgi:hypothetical protein
MDLLWGVILALEIGASVAVTLHALAWLHLLLVRRAPSVAPLPVEGDDLPVVTVQLPLYNELDQVDGLLASMVALDWPAERLEFQVLDDSTDATPARVAARVAELRAQGVDIHHIRRESREGFKAGALAAGMTTARGERVAIFDADFRPEPDFLRRAIGVMGPDLGMVQARWAFSNGRASTRTRAQALHLDAHFALEQQARSSAGLMMGFNGTAGVWRRACIEAAGGWHADTLTEDLDLAYRAQLAGWRLGYVDALSVQSELPDAMSAIRAQQHRWIRGGAQVARKLLATLWRSEQPALRKVQGTAHLLASSVYVPVLVLCVLAPGLPWVLAMGPDWAVEVLAVPSVLLRGVLLALLLCFASVCVRRQGGVVAGLWRLVKDFPVYLGLATAIAPWCARAAWMGWTAPTGTFERTPKGAAQHAAVPWPVTLPAEVLLAAWSWVGVAVGLATGQLALAVFLGLQAVAVSALVGMTVRGTGSVAVATRTDGALPAGGPVRDGHRSGGQVDSA